MRQLLDRIARGVTSDVVVHGAGDGGRQAISELREIGIEPSKIFDSSAFRHGEHLSGLPICEPKSTNALVLIASMHSVEIAQLHHDLGNECFYFGPCFERERFFTPINPDVKNSLTDLMDDSESQSTLNGLINFRETVDPLTLKRSPYSHFSHPIAKPRKGDHVVDAGAWEGDTTEIIRRLVGSAGRITCFEPSPRSASRIKEAPNVSVREQGLWSSNCRGYMVDSERNSTADQVEVLQSGSHSLENNHRSSGQFVTLVALDSVEIGKVDVIKMDIEGAEREALRGAKETIRRWAPRLMISVYHHYDDLWEIPAEIGEIRPYKFFLGHHTDYAFDTVLYAVPL